MNNNTSLPNNTPENESLGVWRGIRSACLTKLFTSGLGLFLLYHCIRGINYSLSAESISSPHRIAAIGGTILLGYAGASLIRGWPLGFRQPE